MLRQMSAQFLTAVVVAANIVGATMAIPQARKVRLSRRVDGVSPVWAAVSTAVNAAWVPYGLAVGDVGIIPVSVVSVMAYVTIAVGICRFGTDPAPQVLTRMVGSGLGILVVPATVLVVRGWAAAGVTLGLLYGVQLAPAVVAVYRSADVSGVSAATWVIAFAEAALWGVYGFGRLDPGLMSLAASGMFMASLVLARLVVRRPRRDRTTDVAVAGLGLSPA